MRHVPRKPFMSDLVYPEPVVKHVVAGSCQVINMLMYVKNIEWISEKISKHL